MIRGLQKMLDYAKEHPKISEIDVGESGWTVPCMFRMTKNGDVYVQDVELDQEKGGTVQAFIKKTEKGFDVDFSNVEDQGLTVVESEEDLSSGIINPSEFIKVGNIKENKN